MNQRQLTLTCTHGRHSYRPLIPADPARWTRAELSAWKADLVRRDLFDDEVETRWKAMLRWRAEQIEVLVTHQINPIPDEVLATAPLAWRATRRFWADPQLPLISHALASEIAACRSERARGTQAAARRLVDAGYAWARKHTSAKARWTDGLVLRGDLHVFARRARLLLMRRGDVLLDAPACDAQLPRLRRIVVLWHRLVRRAIADRLGHAVPVAYSRTTEARIEYALRIKGTREATDAYVLRDDRVCRASVEMLTTRRGEHAARMELAARFLRHREPYASTLDDVATEAVDALAYGIFASLDVELPDDTQRLAAMDDVARAFIRPAREGCQVAWGEPTDAFDVYRDGTCGPEFIGRVPQLTTAIALERAHRREVTMRLRLGVAGTQIGYSLTAPAA